MATRQNVSQLITLSPPVGLGGEKLWLCPSLSKNGDTGQAFDLSGRVNNGTYNGGMGTFVNTESGGTRSYELDGSDDYIDTGNDDSIDLRPGVDPLTFTAWIKPDTIAGGDTFSTTNPRYVIQKGSSVGARFQYGWRILGGKLDFFYRNSADTFFCILRADSSVVNAGEWQHIALVHDGTTATHYLNGSVVPSTVVSGSMSNLAYDSNEPVIIGKEPTQRYFDGLIDDVRIHSRVLTAAEIKHLATARGIQGNGKTRLKARYNEPAGVLVPTRTSFLAWYRSGFDKAGAISPTTQINPIGLGGEELWLCPSLSKNGDTQLATDLSGRVNNGTYNGGMGTVAYTGAGGTRAYSLDGVDDYLNVPDDDTLDLSGDFTLSLWVERLGGGGTLISKGSYNGGASDWEIFLGGANRYIFSINNVFVVTLLDYDYLATGWRNIVIRRTGSNVTGYTNGIADGTGTSSQDLTNTEPLRIGARSNGTTFYDCNVDDVRIYGRALTATEIKHLATARGIQGNGRYPVRSIRDPQAGVPVPTRTNFLGWYRSWFDKAGAIFPTTQINPIGLGGEKLWLCPSLSKNGDTGQAFDLSGNANHCTYNGGMVAATKMGKGGSKAYEFLNSGDYISGLPFYFNQDFTYSGWINATDLTSDAFYLFGDGNTQTIRVPAGSDPGTWQSIIKGYTPDRVQIASAISSGVWHHVVTVIRGSNHEVWIDGELAGKVAITGTGSAPSFNRIGYGFGGDNGVGYADDARVYQRALTPSEIKHLSKGRGIQGNGRYPVRSIRDPQAGVLSPSGAGTPKTRTLLGVGL